MSLRFIAPMTLLALSASTSVQAQTASVALSEEAALFQYSTLVGGQSFGRTEFGIGALYNSADTLLGEVGLQVVDEAGTRAPGLELGIGGKLIGATLANDLNVLAFAIGGQFRYALPPLPRAALATGVYYAPDIVSFQDMQNFWQLSVRAEYEVLPQAAAYLGYRKFAGRTTTDRNVDADEGFHVGMRISF